MSTANGEPGLSLLPGSAAALFDPRAIDQATGLSAAEQERYSLEGWLGPYPLLNPAGVALASRLNDENAERFTPAANQAELARRGVMDKRPWFKSMHALLPFYYDLVGHPAIISRLSPLLGPDILCWGTSVTVRKPLQKHRWHVDVEHRRWPGATIFLGLRGMTPQSSLKIISRSHLIDAVPQELGVSSNEAALSVAQRWQPQAQLVNVDLQEGEFFIFHGRLWHGSENTSAGSRLALLAQYSPAGVKAEIPLGWNEPIRWLDCKLPCVLVCGANSGPNRVIGRPH